MQIYEDSIVLQSVFTNARERLEKGGDLPSPFTEEVSEEEEVSRMEEDEDDDDDNGEDDDDDEDDEEVPLKMKIPKSSKERKVCFCCIHQE